jgi:hypothetical protein
LVNIGRITAGAIAIDTLATGTGERAGLTDIGGSTEKPKGTSWEADSCIELSRRTARKAVTGCGSIAGVT